MRQPNEGMWNSSTHAMSDICSLAYRVNVPACEVIVPAGTGAVEQAFESRDRALQTSSTDISWNRATPTRGRGRGALLQNRDGIHENVEELQKQLRLANGLGYSNDLIEARFQNSSSPNELFQRTQPHSRETDTSSHATTTQDTRTQQVDQVEATEEAVEGDNDGGWNWETRTAEPAPNRIILKNVALESFKRQNKTYPAVKPLIPASPAMGLPAHPASPMPRAREDWRAECKAVEQARNGSPKAKKGERSSLGQPLLGDLKVVGNWSAFAPNTVTPVAPVESYPRAAPAPEPEGAAAVASPPMSIFEGQIQRGRKNKKKNQNLRVMYVPPPLRADAPTASAAPAGYLMPTNGVSPLSLRNSGYYPRGDTHRTFTNVFGQVAQNRDCRTYNRNSAFSLARDEFPQLK